MHDPIRFALSNSLRLASKCRPTKNRNGSKQICLSVRRSSRHSHVSLPSTDYQSPLLCIMQNVFDTRSVKRCVSTMFKRSIEKTKTAHNSHIFGCIFSKNTIILKCWDTCHGSPCHPSLKHIFEVLQQTI